MAGYLWIDSIISCGRCGSRNWPMGWSHISLERFRLFKYNYKNWKYWFLFFYSGSNIVGVPEFTGDCLRCLCCSHILFQRQARHRKCWQQLLSIQNQFANYLYLIFLANGWGLAGACSLIVIMGTLAHLASVASSIVVYKDWIVIIAGCETQKLASNYWNFHSLKHKLFLN